MISHVRYSHIWNRTLAGRTFGASGNVLNTDAIRTHHNRAGYPPAHEPSRASVYSNPLPVEQGKFTEAEPLNQRSLAIEEAVLGTEHPVVACSLNHVAASLKSQVRTSLVRSIPRERFKGLIRGHAGQFRA